MRAWGWLLFLCAALPSCDSCARTRSSSPALRHAPPAPALDEPRPTPAHLVADGMWTQAIATQDAMDLAALADQEGATGLLVVLESGGPAGRTALRALAYAPDAELSLRRLGQLSLQVTGSTRVEVLDVFEQVALRADPPEEPLDPEGAQSAADALTELAARAGIGEEVRARAISVLRLLADRGLVRAEAGPQGT